ncbi:MAG: hypothetical protein GXP46_09850, partial [Deferribacteres bacterium]|nr:hypothetical protein [Deferribacteres bacterium]
GAVLLDRVVATVNNEVITWSELVNMIKLEGKAYLENVPAEERRKRIRELEKPFLNRLIQMKLELQEARKMGLSVSDAEIDSAVEDIRRKFDLTEEALMASLRAEGMSLEDYRARLKEQILISKVVNYAIKSRIVITDREIRQYYEANKEKFTGKEKVKIRQIFFAAPADDSQKAAVEARAREVMQRLKKGEDFARLAIQFSEGPSRQFGGDLGYISRGSALREVEDVAFALKTGEVSKPFWSPAGLHIIKVEDRIEADGMEKAREKIKISFLKRHLSQSTMNGAQP